jgi:recombination protein RecA
VTRRSNSKKAVSVIRFTERIARQCAGGLGRGLETLSTGSLAIDLALGVGGLPRGRIIEVFGPESSGQNHAA